MAPETMPLINHRRLSANLVALTRLLLLACLLLFTVAILMPAAITNHHKTPQSMEKETVRLPSSSTTKITVLSTTKKEQIQDEEDAECGAQNLENSPSVKLPLDGQCGMLAGQKFVYDCIPSNYRQLFRNLPPQSLSNWSVPKLYLQIIAFNRPESLQRLIRSLLDAEHLQDSITLTFHIEANGDDETLRIINNFTWPFGQKLVHRRITEAGLMHAIVESWYPASRNDYTIILEDDIEVSPLYYLWTKLTLLRYRYGDRNEPRLFGISLYTPRLQEMNYPRKRFFPDTVFTPLFTPFLWQLPCSWGAIYFPETWQEFHVYLNGRLRTNLSETEVVIPESRSNFWKFSWKKYFIEMIVLRGYFMLYPNFQNQTSFSTNHLEPGMHIGPKSRVRLQMMDEFRVPLMKPSLNNSSSLFLNLPGQTLPAISELPIINLFAKSITVSDLIKYGQMLKPNLYSCAVHQTIVRDFANGNFTCL